MLDTLKLAQNAQRSLSREVSALQPKACRIRKAPGMQVSYVEILTFALKATIACGHELWGRVAESGLVYTCADMILDILAGMLHDVTVVFRTQNTAQLTAVLKSLGDLLWLCNGAMLTAAVQFASSAAVSKLATAAVEALQSVSNGTGDVDDPGQAGLLFLAARYMRMLGSPRKWSSHLQLAVAVLQDSVLPWLCKWRPGGVQRHATLILPLVDENKAHSDRRISWHQALVVLLADELAASIAIHAWHVMMAKSAGSPSSCVLQNGAELKSVCQALSLGRSLEVLWSYLSTSLSGRLRRATLDNSIRLPAESAHGRQLAGEREVAVVLTCLTSLHLEIADMVLFTEPPPRAQMDQFLRVQGSLRTAPAQDAVVLLLHQEQVLQMAVRTGDPAIDANWPPVRVILEAVVDNDIAACAQRPVSAQTLFIAEGGCRALAMAIDAATKLKRTDILHPLCDILSVLEPLAPDPAHWQQPPVDARLKDLSEKQDPPPEVPQAGVAPPTQQQRQQPQQQRGPAATAQQRQATSAARSPAAAQRAAAAAADAAAAEAMAERMASLLMQEEDNQKQQEAARAAKAARKAKRRQQKQGKQTSDVSEPTAQQGHTLAEPASVREPAAASGVAPVAQPESWTAAAKVAEAQPPASGTAAGAGTGAQDADTAWQLCPLSKERMVDPVLLPADAHTYERPAITAWLQQHGTSPLTGQPAEVSSLMPNHTLRSLLQAMA